SSADRAGRTLALDHLAARRRLICSASASASPAVPRGPLGWTGVRATGISLAPAAVTILIPPRARDTGPIQNRWMRFISNLPRASFEASRTELGTAPPQTAPRA